MTSSFIVTLFSSQSCEIFASYYSHSHSNFLIPIPMHLIPIPIPWLIVLPFPWESHGTRWIPVFLIPTHVCKRKPCDAVSSCLSTSGRTRRSVTLCLAAPPLVCPQHSGHLSVECSSVSKKERASGTRLSRGEL